MNTFSYFAECKVDSIALVSAIRSTQIDSQDGEQWFECKATVIDDDYMIGCAIEIQTDMTFGQVMRVAQSVPDGHVLRQTLRQVALSENSLKRDWSVL